MYHSIIFDDAINTWDDWHLIPSTRPVVNPPEVKTNFLDIPGGNGSIDATEALTGYPTYENRTGSWEFYVANGYKDWDVAYSDILNYLHGRRRKAVLEDDLSFYYEGRFSVNEWKSDKIASLITIDYNVYPYKRNIDSTGEDWLWDPFDFETGIINELKALTVDGSLEVTVINRQEHVVPTITVSGTGSNNMTLTFNNKEYSLVPGKNVNGYIVLQPGENTLKFTGNGTVTIDYRGGSL